MLWVVHGVTYWYMAGSTMHGFPAGFRALGSGYWLGIPIPVYLMFALPRDRRAVRAAHDLGPGDLRDRREPGRGPAVGRADQPAPRARLHALGGAMAGLASLIFLARLNSAEGDIGESLTLPAIAAVLIGGTSLFGGVGTVGGTLVGALILTLVLNGMNLLALNANWQPLVTGVIVIARGVPRHAHAAARDAR